MKALKIIFLAMSLAAAAAACGGDEDEPAAPALADVEGYRAWPLTRKVTQSAGGHGGTADVYANTVVANYLVKVAALPATGATIRYPEGSIIVKDVFNADGSLKYVAIMRKTATPPEGAEAFGGWVWSQRHGPTKADEWRSQEACLDCHVRANEEAFRDGVFVFPACTGAVVCDEK